jgi:hypothetical protein
VFRLRSECAKLGETQLYKSAHTEFAQSQINPRFDQQSHYNPDTNRCYVEIDMRNNFLFTRNLYDGQTGDMLAWISETPAGDSKEGMIFTKNEQSNQDFQGADSYINQMMHDDRSH